MTHSDKAGWNLFNSYSKLPGVFYARQAPTPVADPQLVLYNEPLAGILGLHDIHAEQLSGNEIPEGAQPIAQAYAGHQFGHFTMLGDGRAVLLGEQMTPGGERCDIQLKGAGPTPYSRRGDGRASLGPMLREYVISEAMHGLGVPTNRSLAVVTTGETVQRETEWPGAVLTRVAASHLRVGTFQYAAKQGDAEHLRVLVQYATERHFPELEAGDHLGFYREVVRRQAQLIAQWQLVGFVHGVMNTDNMTISGETMDYGPCAFLDIYNPDTVFSSIDTSGRYAYKNQPAIAMWNLARFAETLIPLLDEKQEAAVEELQEILSGFGSLFKEHWLNGMRSKLGLTENQQQDEPLIEDLLDIMEKNKADYTETFRLLTQDRMEESSLSDTTAFTQWYKQWQARLDSQAASKTEAYETMKRTNPALIPRNHLVEEALAAAVSEEDYGPVKKLIRLLSDPYAYSEEQIEYAVIPVPPGPYQTFCGT
ncbi:UNVERIFIED_CONTAM: YdiU family protein [Halobacillus marinus]